MARLIIQIACCPGEGTDAAETIYALCDDGTLWNGVWVGGERGISWREIDAPFTKESGGNIPLTAPAQNAAYVPDGDMGVV